MTARARPLVPAENAEMIARRFGAPGRRFLDELEPRLAQTAARWGLTLGAPLPVGIGGFLTAVRCADGDDAVLKLSPTGGAQDVVNAREAWALERWRGNGAVRLLRAEPAAGALLLERCVPGATIDALPDEDMVPAGCAVARRLHRRPDADAERILPHAVEEVAARAREAGAGLAAVGRAVPPSAERALVAAHAEIARDDAALVVCHGDLNPGNLLSARRAPWLAVDPLPVLAPPAYDAVSLVWSRRAWLLGRPDPGAVLRHRIAAAAAALGAPERTVWAWTLARIAGLLIERAGWGGYDDASFVHVAELLGERPPGRG